MTFLQFHTICELLQLNDTAALAATELLLTRNVELQEACRVHQAVPAEAALLAQTIEAAALRIRGAFVVHSPIEFRVLVGHHDEHRMPGTLAMNVGDTIRLVAFTTERYIPVQVDVVPGTPAGYFEGVVLEQLATGSKFQRGDRVRFSEDQVVAATPQERRGRSFSAARGRALSRRR